MGDAPEASMGAPGPLGSTADRVLLFDGAMGTALRGRLGDDGRPPVLCTLTDANAVMALHRDYLTAGADVIETNTFGANRVSLDAIGATVSVGALNRAAVALAMRAREEAGQRVLVAGSVAPAAAPHARGAFAALARDALCEQAECLASAGVDLLVFETFSGIDELAAVLSALGGAVPVVASFTFSPDGATFGGDPLAEVLATMTGVGVSAIGVNCLLGPVDLRPVVTAMDRGVTMPVLAQPVGLPRNAGPKGDDGAAEAAWARATWSLVARGAAMVGGCCGTTPAHIAALAGERAASGAGNPRIGR